MSETISIDHRKKLEAAGESATEAEDHATLIRACLGAEIAADPDLTINIVTGLRNETLARATLAYVEARGEDGEADSSMRFEQQRILAVLQKDRTPLQDLLAFEQEFSSAAIFLNVGGGATNINETVSVRSPNSLHSATK